MRTVLTIAGSDCSGGAGIQADMKTITAHKLYAMSAITALTAQNTTGVYGILETPPEFLAKQLDCIFEDIQPDAVKIGMVVNENLIDVISEKLRNYCAKNIVIDPVMISTSGSRLLSESAIHAMTTKLFPLASVITPNIPEAECLSGIRIKSMEDMEKAAGIIGDMLAGAVLIKGGHQVNAANDMLYEDGEVTWFYGNRIDTSNTHGTGCTLSSAIACGLACGKSRKESITSAKEYISGALAAKLNLGKGNGPLEHTYWLKIEKGM